PLWKRAVESEEKLLNRRGGAPSGAAVSSHFGVWGHQPPSLKFAHCNITNIFFKKKMSGRFRRRELALTQKVNSSKPTKKRL
ncbi:MAG: hypothetical protein Q8R70_13105, partial [Methanoregula sp.]|nr:hypothetical protein [Methanoregula sp.]